MNTTRRGGGAGGRRLLAAALAAAAVSACHAGADSSRFCDRSAPLAVRQQDRLLQFAALVKRELDASGSAVALVARSGQDLRRFGVRYSHAGVSLQASDNGAWSVRQLYFACDEGRPRLFDQGIAGFLYGTDDADLGYVSLVLLPAAEGDALARAALDRPRALRLIAARYSANAYAWSVRYQNCNQWVMELLAAAWGDLPDAPDLRAQAQRWLADARYAPRPVPVNSHLLMAAANFIPWLHVDDHPADDRFALQFVTSLPASIDAFVQARVPGARRIELCHDREQVVVRLDGPPIEEGCVARAGDRVERFE